MVNRLKGLRVQIYIDEQAVEGNRPFPPGTVVRILLGENGVAYPVIRLDRPVLYPGHGAHEDTTVDEAVVAAANPSEPLTRLVTQSPGEIVHVGIFSPTEPLDAKATTLDSTRLAYLAMGHLERA